MSELNVVVTRKLSSVVGFLLLATYVPCAAEDEAKTDFATSIVIHSVKPQQRARNFVTRYGITRGDFAQIAETIPNLTKMLPLRIVAEKAGVGDRTCQLMVIGTTADYPRFHFVKVKAGRFLSDHDFQQNNNVVVLGADIAEKLFEKPDAMIGDAVRIGDNFYTVIGVVAEQEGQVPQDTGISKSVFIPLTTMRARMGDTHLILNKGSTEAEQFEISRIDIALDGTPADIKRTAALLGAMLSKTHESTDFRIEVKE